MTHLFTATEHIHSQLAATSQSTVGKGCCCAFWGELCDAAPSLHHLRIIIFVSGMDCRRDVDSKWNLLFWSVWILPNSCEAQEGDLFICLWSCWPGVGASGFISALLFWVALSRSFFCTVHLPEELPCLICDTKVLLVKAHSRWEPVIFQVIHCPKEEFWSRPNRGAFVTSVLLAKKSSVWE